MISRRAEPLTEVCGELRSLLSPPEQGSPADVRALWPWAARLLLLRTIRARKTTALLPFSFSDSRLLTTLVRQGDPSVGELLPPLRPFETVSFEPEDAALDGCVEYLFGDNAGDRNSRELDGMLDDPRALGRAFQLWHVDERAGAYDRALASKDEKIGGRQLVAATQLFTPAWMSRFLVQNSLGTQICGSETRPDSWEYYLTSNSFGTTDLESLSFLDPACGCGSILIEAFGLLFDSYSRSAEEVDPEEISRSILERNLMGFDLDRQAVDIASASLTLEATARGATLAGYRPRLIALTESLDQPERHLDRFLHTHPHFEPLQGQLGELCRAASRLDEVGSLLDPIEILSSTPVDPAAAKATLESLLADLDRHLPTVNHLTRDLRTLAEQHDVVVTNPPYMSNRQLGDSLRGFVTDRYPRTAADLYACFLMRLERFTRVGGSFALVCPLGWTTLSSFARFREELVQRSTITSFVSLGQRSFVEAGLVFVGLCTFRRTVPKEGDLITAIKLDHLDPPARPRRLRAECNGRGEDCAHEVPHDALGASRRSAFTFFVSAGLRRLLAVGAPTLGDRADVIAGIDTGKNARFVRYSWEVEMLSSDRWRRYSKGKGYLRWHTPMSWRIDWRDNGRGVREHPGSAIRNERFFFRKGLEYSYVFGGKLSCRELSSSILDHGSGGIFPHDERDLALILGLLNSRLATTLARTLSPTLNMPVGRLGALPFPAAARPAVLETIALLSRVCAGLKSWLDDHPLGLELELGKGQSWRAVTLSARRSTNAVSALLHHLEGALEVHLHDAFGLAEEDTLAVFEEAGRPAGLLPLLEGHESLPACPLPGDARLDEAWRIAETTFAPGEVLSFSLDRTQRLREIVESADPGTTASLLKGRKRAHLPAETLIEGLASELGVHPFTVHDLLEEGASQHGWRDRGYGRACAAELIAAILARLLETPRRTIERERTSGRLAYPGILPLTAELGTASAVELLRSELSKLLASTENSEPLGGIEESLGRPLAQWLEQELFKFLVAKRRRRPEIWHLRSRGRGKKSRPSFSCLLSYRHLDSATLPTLLDRLVQPARVTTRTEELEDFATRLERVIERGFTADDRSQPYEPDLNDGIRINIAPLQREGLLACPVLTAKDVERALSDRARWRL